LSETKVLDKGFVRLVDSMGDDSSIVQAARVSYGKGTKTVNEDRGLIRYLIRMKHSTPVELVDFKFHVKLPIFVARQWMRHRACTFNEYSGRYSIMSDDCYIPELDRITEQSTDNKQGSSNIVLDDADNIQLSMEQQTQSDLDNYHDFLDKGVSREIARINLPVSNYTEFYWKINLHNLFHFLKLRMDSHAQYEIRVYAEAIYEMIKEIVPLACEAFDDYVLNAEQLSSNELFALRHMIFSRNISKQDISSELQSIEHKLSKRELDEFIKKLGFIV